MKNVSLFCLLLILVIFSLGVISASENHFFAAKELASPSDWIDATQIKVYQHKVVLNLENVSWANFTNTNSMDPFLDESAHALEIHPNSANEIQIGDVISYRSGEEMVIHRVVEIGNDEQGTYFIVKGDNNSFNDPAPVYFDQIVGVVVAVLY